MGQEVVALERVSKRFGAEQILRDVSLTVEAGEMIALMGRSGSGKSTLLHLVGGLDRTYEGTIRVLGQDLGALSDGALSALRNEQVGFVFQSFHLLDHLSVLENVALPALLARGRRVGELGEAPARAREALSRVGMLDKAEALPSRLSGGQKQRVAIARALFHRPRLILADEPTGNLDSETGQQIIDLFRELNAEGLTLFMVTHEERVSAAARRVVRIEDGRIANDQPVRVALGVV
ncbi:MAG TPA: ABC transporter ATP-binding protein [Polyangia bacterium]|jgi:ABC-type lipoprotein export system ATPase subunit|nr:ABC transporter ATP-binding protein [Polyangia bacterium]